MLPVSIYAEETTSQESTQEQSTSQPESNPSPQPETDNQETEENSTPEQESPPTSNEIQTGDAASQATQDATVNESQTTTQGDVTAGGCNVDIDLNCNPSTANEADVSGESDAVSTTGVNEIESAPGNAEIETGDAASQASGQNQINTNVVEATDEAGLENDSGAVADTPPRNDGLTIEMENEATLEATASAESVSGQNEITEAGGDAMIETGDSISQAALANLVNSNILGSNFEFFLLPIFDAQSGDIDLNALWKLIQQKIAEQSASLEGANNVYIINSNQATVNLTADSTAISGQNSASQNGGGATIYTGDSIATANIFNLINLNIIGSNFLFGVINIFGSLTGNIIVPSPYRFLEYLAQNGLYDESLIGNHNYALVSSDVNANADSGTNSQLNESSQSLASGDAIAYASNTTFANLNILMANWYFLILNNFGFWSGTVDSWENSASSTPQTDESATYELNNPQTITGEANGGNTDVVNQNSVEVYADVHASAVSGQNNTWNNLFSWIRTGRSIALANIFNLLNTNIIGSNFFMPIINLFGAWRGNLVFAYPNLQVSMTADKEEVNYGDSLNYTVTYENIGYEEARNVTLNIALPAEASLNSVSGPKFAANGNSLQFFVGDVSAKSGGSFSISVNINKLTSQSRNNTIWQKLSAAIVKPVEAADNGREIMTTADIQTPDPETDMSSNSFSVVTYLITADNSEPTTESVKEVSEPGLTPVLEVSSGNNSGEYVYSGDILTFFADVKNSGEGKALDTIIYQNIVFNNQILVQNKFELEEIEGGKSKKLAFSIKLPRTAKSGDYQSVIYADAKSTAGELFYSNDSYSQFRVKSKHVAAKAKAVDKRGDGSVLAAENTVLPSQGNWINLLYLLIFALSLLWYVEYVRRREAEESLEFLTKPSRGMKIPKFPEKKTLLKRLFSLLRRTRGQRLSFFWRN